MRRLFFFLMAAFAAAFLWTFVATNTVTHAATEAVWKDSSTITYNNDDYTGPASEETVKNIGLPNGTPAYTHLGPVPNAVNRNNTGTVAITPSKQLLYVIFFGKGTDITTAKTAKYITAEYIDTTSFRNLSKPINISLDTTNANKVKSGGSSCTVTGGIGWIICPVSKFIAFSLDYAYSALSDFLVVRPILADPNSALFTAWNYMRNFANIAFVVVFLIIIYSQLTNFGINNYGLKKLLPRLIIAALLVNLSYYICSIAVDISNVLGYSIRDVFTNMSSGLAGTNTANIALSFENMTGFILSGGVTAAVGVLAFIQVGGIGGAFALLIPALVTGLMALLVALLVMAGRQAIITIFIIISPLAFVAYLLPNTEKWFEKWRSTFMTMLIIFPAFSVIFGGSQLASEAIIRNADSINILILGMFVKVAPLFITPWLLKLGGPMLNSLANMVSKPNSLITGAAKKYGEDLQQTAKAKWLGGDAHKANLLRRAGQNVDQRARNREYSRTAFSGRADARWKNTSKYRDIDQIAREAGDYKAIGEGRSELRYNNSKLTPGALQTMDTRLRRINDEVSASKGTADSEFEVMRSEEYKNTPEWNNLSTNMKDHLDAARIAATSIKAQSARKQSALNVQQIEFGKALDQSADLRRTAGASVIDKLGEQRAQAAANSVVSKAHAETIANATSIITRGNLDDNMVVELARGNRQQGSNGQWIEATDDTIEAAIGKIMSGGNIKAQTILIENLPLTKPGDDVSQEERERLEGIRLAFAEGYAKSPNRPKYHGQGYLAQVGQGLAFGGMASTDKAIIETINGRKYNANNIPDQDKDGLDRLFQMLERYEDGQLDPSIAAAGVVLDPDSLAVLRTEIKKTHSMDLYSGKTSEIDPYLDKILTKIPEDSGGPDYTI